MIQPEHVRDAARIAQQAAWSKGAIPPWVFSPRKLVAWLGIALAMLLLRWSVKTLPRQQPIRLFIEGLVTARPFRLRDLPENLAVPAVMPDGDDGPSPRPAPAH